MMEVTTTKNQNLMEVTLMLHGNERIIKHKLGLLNLAEELGNVSQACRVMGLSRDTFYRYKEAMDNGGVEDKKKPLCRRWFCEPRSVSSTGGVFRFPQSSRKGMTSNPGLWTPD